MNKLALLALVCAFVGCSDAAEPTPTPEDPNTPVVLVPSPEEGTPAPEEAPAADPNAAAESTQS